MPTEVCQPIISRASISLDTTNNPSTRPSCQSTSACPSGSSEPQDHPRCLRNTSTGVDGRADGSTPSSLSPCSAPAANMTGALGPVLTRGSVRRAPKSIVLLRPERVGYQGGPSSGCGCRGAGSRPSACLGCWSRHGRQKCKPSARGSSAASQTVLGAVSLNME